MKRITIEVDGPLYIHLGSGTAARTDELVEGMVMADYDKDGRLLGIEVLGPMVEKKP